MTGHRSPERKTEQTSSSEPSDTRKNTQFFDVARGVTTPHEQGANSLDIIKQMTHPQEVRNITFGRDLIRTEESAAKAQLAEKESDKKKGKRPAGAEETIPEAKRTKPEQSADNQGNASRSNETRLIGLKEMEQIIIQAPHSREGANRLIAHYMELDRWLHQNQSRQITQEYQINRQMLQNIDTAIEKRTTAILREVADNADQASREQLQNQQKQLKGWLDHNESRNETEIYQLNEKIMKLVEGRIQIKRWEEQLAQNPLQ